MRVLIVYVTAGTGHRRAAEAVAEALRQRDSSLDVECVDLLSSVPRWLRLAYPGAYEWLVRWAPWLWAAAYYAVDHPAGWSAVQPLRRLWNGWMARRFAAALAAQPPEAVVTTHFFPTDVVGRLQASGRFRRPLLVAITDLFPHRFWLTAEPAAILVGTEEVKRCCVARGAPAEGVHVTGIPIRLAFAQAPDRRAALQQLGLEASRRTILITGGGMGVGPIEALVGEFLRLEASVASRLQLVVICGKDASLARRLRARGAEATIPLRVEGFVDAMPLYLRAADLLIAKPGGLTVVESLAMGLPMILMGAIPGQERFNAEYAVAHGAAVRRHTVAGAVSAALQFLEHPDELERMHRCAAGLGRPGAAFDIADVVLSHARRS